MKVAVVIPAYNESSQILKVIQRLEKKLSNENFMSEIVVVNDGSTDNTEKVVSHTSAIIINHILNSGSGSATATGLYYAQINGFDIAVTMDADGQHSEKDVLKGINKMNKSNYDLLIGSRLLNPEGMSRSKIFGNKSLSFITFMLFGVMVTDSQSGLRVFSRKSLMELRWKTSGFEFCYEMIWRARQKKLKIGEFPINTIYTDYSRSKGQSNWNGFNILKSLIERRVMEIFSE